MVGTLYETQAVPEDFDINAAPDGMWDLGPRWVAEEYYDIVSDRMFHGLELRLVARIDSDGKHTPRGVDAWWFRPDGARVVKQWLPVNPLPDYVTYQQTTVA